MRWQNNLLKIIEKSVVSKVMLLGVVNLVSPALLYHQQIIKEPYEYICQVKGKEVRLLLINAFDAWLHIPPEKKAEIGILTQMLHNASLL